MMDYKNQFEANPEIVYLTRAWLEKQGWEPVNNYPLFQHDPEYIDADLCVVVDRKCYMVAKFHHMGDNARKPWVKPESFDIVGVNNYVEMSEYDIHKLIMAAYVCGLTVFKDINRAIGGVREITIKRI